MTYYVYELVIIPDGNVCYVGKGKNKRMYDHKRNMRSSHGPTTQLGLYRRLRELIASGKDFYPRKVFETYSETLAFWEEGRRIQLYGFNNLFNSTTLTGPQEKDLTETRSQAISKGVKEVVARNRLLYGRGTSPEHRAKIKAAHTRGVWTHYRKFWKAGYGALKRIRAMPSRADRVLILREARKYKTLVEWKRYDSASLHKAWRCGPKFLKKCKAHLVHKRIKLSRDMISFMRQFGSEVKVKEVQDAFFRRFGKLLSSSTACRMTGAMNDT
jgi:hypothetical protein